MENKNIKYSTFLSYIIRDNKYDTSKDLIISHSLKDLACAIIRWEGTENPYIEDITYHIGYDYDNVKEANTNPTFYNKDYYNYIPYYVNLWSDSKKCSIYYYCASPFQFKYSLDEVEFKEGMYINHESRPVDNKVGYMLDHILEHFLKGKYK